MFRVGALGAVPLDFQLSCAVAKLVLVNSKLIEKAQEQIRHWCVRRILNMASALDLA